MEFLPFARPTIDESMIAAVADTLRSRWIVTGPRVAAFEEAGIFFCLISFRPYLASF